MDLDRELLAWVEDIAKDRAIAIKSGDNRVVDVCWGKFLGIKITLATLQKHTLRDRAQRLWDSTGH